MKIDFSNMESYIGNPVYVIKDNVIQKTMIKSIRYIKAVGLVSDEHTEISTSLGDHNADVVFDSKEDIIEYIGKDSVYYAKNFARRVLSAIEQLKMFPHSGKIVPEYNNPNIRELLFQNYRIVYKIDESEVYIALIIHGSKELPSSLRINDIG